MDATGRLRKGTYCSRVFTLATSLPPSRLPSPQAAYKGGAAVPLPAEFLSEVDVQAQLQGRSMSISPPHPSTCSCVRTAVVRLSCTIE